MDGVEAIMSTSCCGVRLLGFKISASQKQPHFDLRTAKEKAMLWNEIVHKHVRKEHKPLPLAKNLDDQANGHEIFNSSGGRHVFANICEERITKQVQKLAGPQPGPSQPTTFTRKGKERASVELNTGTFYDPENIIFEYTIPEGHYIKAGTFLKHYAKKTRSA